MPNRLAQETSPYLQQHADNPVDWYPWGEEALAEARRTGKPILLSVGYSACHWCHVMAHESFEDPEIARVMNELFVNIKVDREERPDIDQVYQVAQAMLTQRNGGWPLTMFLSADQVPFFGGTYFPPTPRYGMPGFPDLLRRVREFHDAHPEDIRETGQQVAAAMGRMEPRADEGRGRPDRTPLEEAAASLLEGYDKRYGGFSGAPKFPHAETIELLLRRHAFTGEREPLEAATLTLTRMAEGGIFDHVGGGFARYSVDERWAIPHFEKMLYDNGWLLRLYADAWTLTKDPLYERAVAETAGWVMREMQSPEGGFYSSLDADSEGEEGKFYVWTPDEVRALLTPEEYAAFAPAYGLEDAPNFEGHAWHLAIARPIDEAQRPMLDSARRKLAAAREKRVRPGRDDKVLTSWNALMVAGLMRAGRAFGRDDWIDAAFRALDFLRGTMWTSGKLLATYKSGRAHLDAYLDDHAFLVAALLEAMQARFRPRDLAWACELADALLERFQDREDGGFWFTSHDHERLIHRQKPGPDNATPSGNGMAAWALQRLSYLTGESRYAEAAERTLELFRPRYERQPAAFGTLLMALEEYLAPPRTIILTGPPAGFADWREMLDRRYLPTTMVLSIPTGTEGLPLVLAKPASDAVNAWVCEGVTCLPPESSRAKLQARLDSPTI